MSKYSNPIEDYVFSLSSKDFKDLINAVNKRIDKDRYGFVSFEEAAISYKRIPACPKCGSASYHLDGKTNAGNTRCLTCSEIFCTSCCATEDKIVSSSSPSIVLVLIFSSSKITATLCCLSNLTYVSVK